MDLAAAQHVYSPSGFGGVIAGRGAQRAEPEKSTEHPAQGRSEGLGAASSATEPEKGTEHPLPGRGEPPPPPPLGGASPPPHVHAARFELLAAQSTDCLGLCLRAIARLPVPIADRRVRAHRLLALTSRSESDGGLLPDDLPPRVLADLSQWCPADVNRAIAEFGDRL